MQSNDQQSRTEGALNHPSEAEWMEFLYEEVSSTRKGELLGHLRECPDCAQKVGEWRMSMRALDSWRVPKPKQADAVMGWSLQRALSWAAAAAVVLMLGFVLGRTTSGADRQIRSLEASVARLARAQQAIVAQHDQVVQTATRAAGEQAAEVLNAYAQNIEDQRLEDRRTTALALGKLEGRIEGLRTELQTVAVNTQDGLQETHASLAQLAMYSKNSATPNQIKFNRSN